MFIKCDSDIHTGILEMYGAPEYIPDLTNIDVYILAGDVCEEKNSRSWITNLCKVNPNTQFIEVAGNHLYYRGNIEKCHNRRLELQESLPNYYFLENDSVIINGIKFIGACLWTDMNKRDEIVIHNAWKCMNDYRKITYTSNYARFSPYRSIVLHENSKEYIFKTLEASKEPCIVVTHHQPFITEIQDDLSYAYMSDMEKEFNMCANLPIMWFSAHTHKSHDIVKEYKHGNVRFISNQRAYPSEYDEEQNINKSCFDKDFVVECNI